MFQKMLILKGLFDLLAAPRVFGPFQHAMQIKIAHSAFLQLFGRYFVAQGRPRGSRKGAGS